MKKEIGCFLTKKNDKEIVVVTNYIEEKIVDKVNIQIYDFDIDEYIKK